MAPRLRRCPRACSRRSSRRRRACAR
jgi:hypothetical protein